jgi:uncharacterized protein YciI
VYFMGYLEDGPDGSERLAALRLEHLAYLHVDPAVVVLGSPMFDAAGARVGSCLIVSVPDMVAAEEWFAKEPLNKNGLFKSVRITELRPGTWHPELVVK